MTPQAQQNLTKFETRVRQLLMYVDDLREENQRLRNALQDKEIELKCLEDDVKANRDKYEQMKMARILDISDEDKTMVRRRLNNLIHEVDKVINQLKN